MKVPGLRWGLVLGGLAVSIGLAQKADNLPWFAIQLPSGTTSKSAEVAYMVNAGELYEYILPEAAPTNVDSAACNYVGSAGYGRVGACESMREGARVDHFNIHADVGGSAATRVRAMVFIPGCEMDRLDVAMQGKSVTREVKCVPLPHWTLRGQIVDAVTKTGQLKVDVSYRANWVSRLFEASVEQANVFNRPLIEFDVASMTLSKNRGFSVELRFLPSIRERRVLKRRTVASCYSRCGMEIPGRFWVFCGRTSLLLRPVGWNCGRSIRMSCSLCWRID
jgi:hypothetical protein